MRKHLSVFMLCIRSTIYKLMLIMLAMAAVEFAGFKLSGMDRDWSFGLGKSSGLFGITFAAACLALVVICVLPSQKNSRYGYTLRRLLISERSVFLWHSLSNICSFLILWGTQMALVFALSRLYAGSAAYAEGPQGILVNFYRRDFLHSLFPLDEIPLWIRNFMYAVSLGFSCAYAQLALRHGKKPVAAIMALIYIAVTFITSVGSGSVKGIFTTLLQSALTGACIVLAFDAAHNGKRCKDEED
jgi:hypothetical protein